MVLLFHLTNGLAVAVALVGNLLIKLYLHSINTTFCLVVSIIGQGGDRVVDFQHLTIRNGDVEHVQGDSDVDLSNPAGPFEHRVGGGGGGYLCDLWTWWTTLGGSTGPFGGSGGGGCGQNNPFK